jgi:hypothetical protein
MRFIMIYHPELAQAQTAPTPELVARMTRFIEESTAQGILLSTGGTCGISYGTRVRVKDSKVTVTDGPFAEAKELVGGYALCELPSKEAAVHYTEKFLQLAGGGECEVHQLAG